MSAALVKGVFGKCQSSPSPALREREGPGAERREGEGGLPPALTRLAPLATLSLNAGEGLPGRYI